MHLLVRYVTDSEMFCMHYNNFSKTEQFFVNVITVKHKSPSCWWNSNLRYMYEGEYCLVRFSLSTLYNSSSANKCFDNIIVIPFSLARQRRPVPYWTRLITPHPHICYYSIRPCLCGFVCTVYLVTLQNALLPTDGQSDP